MNYNQSNVSGTSWTRCRAVTINNPLPGKGVIDFLTSKPTGPNCVFTEEIAVALDTETLTYDSGACQTLYSPTAVIQILDPATNNPTGETVTQQNLYNILYSLYIATAKARDAANPVK
jgi:hypothetical protein